MASEDSEKIDTMESETEQFFPGQKRRPRLTMDELISLKDFKQFCYMIESDGILYILSKR